MNKHLEELDILGYSLIEDVLNQDELKEIKSQIEKTWEIQKQEAEIKFDISKGTENNIVRAPFAYNDVFYKTLNNHKIIPYVKEILGDYFILSQQNGVIVDPNLTHSQNKWHRDFPYMDYISDPPLAVNAFFCITDFTFKTGATQLLPHTHKIKYKPSQEYFDKYGISIEAKAGSVFLFNTMLFHRTGINSSNEKRIGLNHLYTKYILKQQIDIPSLLNHKQPEDPFLKMLLGFDSFVPNNILDYRLIRNKEKY